MVTTQRRRVEFPLSAARNDSRESVGMSSKIISCLVSAKSEELQFYLHCYLLSSYLSPPHLFFAGTHDCYASCLPTQPRDLTHLSVCIIKRADLLANR